MAENDADPRIALLVETDRRLALVGKGTMGMVLAAAEKAGLMPPRYVTTEYGAMRTPAGHVFPQRNAEEALDQARIMDAQLHDHSYVAVSRTRTRYPDTVTDWAPLSGEESND